MTLLSNARDAASRAVDHHNSAIAFHPSLTAVDSFADVEHDARCAGRLLPIFLAGSVATVLSTLAAIAVVPLSALGDNGWKVAAALCARHIGGAVNYVAVTTATGAQVTPPLASALPRQLGRTPAPAVPVALNARSTAWWLAADTSAIVD